jgi:diaminopimelate decarboxylase
MRATGKTISKMGLEKRFGTTVQKLMKVNLSRVKRMEKASSRGVMAHITRVILLRACLKDLVHITSKRVTKPSLGSLRMVKSMVRER